jgi:hypothetical protein
MPENTTYKPSLINTNIQLLSIFNLNGLTSAWLAGLARYIVIVIWPRGRILVEIVGEVETNLGEVQKSSSRPSWKVRA